MVNSPGQRSSPPYIGNLASNPALRLSNNTRSLVCPVVDFDPAAEKVDSPVPYSRLLPVGHLDITERNIHDVRLDGREIKTYWLDRVPYTMAVPDRENTVVYTRKTKDGRVLSYELQVLQQPVRARACGSGPRSSADRRPVDPPPVVQLRIFESDEGSRRKEITLSHEATFLLYASLEVARPIAQARMYTGQSVPVLTGVPVSGAAYLDRPTKACYFIFSDLSARHEGWYNLKFDLFEAVKNPSDMNPDNDLCAPKWKRGEHVTGSHENPVNLCFVRSEAFQVYSAKKFPGLDSSTEMSRCIADQGCRVRIRRDVRQRRRPQKPNKDEDEDMLSSRAPSEAPSQVPSHTRSISRNSQHDSEQYRRISLEIPYQQPVLPSMSMPQSPAALANYGHSSPAPSSVHKQSLSSSMLPAPVAAPSTAPATAPASQRPSIASLINHISTTLPTMEPNAAACNPNPSDRFHHSRTSLSSITSLPVERRQLPLPYPVTSSASSPSTQATESSSQPGRDPYRLPKYNLPESTPTKRSLGGHSSSQSVPLKRGARPDAPCQQPSQSNFALLTTGQNINMQPMIEADDNPHTESASDSEDSMLTGPYTYRRADGSVGTKNMYAMIRQR